MVEPRTRLPLLHTFSHQPGAGPNSSTSTHAGFWSKSRTSTYASYHSNPSNWEENYSSNYDDYQAYSFGKPADPETLAGWKVSKREGNETSSSSSDDGHWREGRKKSRDITPRASVVSLDTSTGQPDTSPPRRSHPSQDQQINYYHRGSDSSSALEHHHPAEFEQLKEGTDFETRSRISKYSYDTGYEASNDASSSSRESHRSWSPHNSFAASEAEAVSISSSRRSVNSAQSGNGAHTNSSALGSRPLSAASASTEQISISSSRRSSGSGSEMYVSISSLKFDGESKDQTSENPSVSASTTATPFPAPTPPPAARSTNRSDFDLSYITSGLALSANALSRISDAEDEAIALDFVRSGQESENRGVDHRRLLQRADTRTRLNSTGRSRPVGWQDDSSESPSKVEAGASRIGSPKRTRERAGTIQPTPRTKTASASTEDDFRALDAAGVYLNSTDAVPLSSSLPSSSLLPSSSSLEPNTTTLVGSIFSPSPSNSATSASTLPSIHTHAPFTPIPKSQLFSGLGLLGIGGEPTLYSHSRSRSHSPQGPISPVSPVSPGETIGPGFQDENREEDEEKDNPSSESPGSTPSPQLSPSHPQSEVPSTSAKPDSSQLLNSSASVKSSDSFAYDDSFARGLMTWGGKEYGVLRREWVVRRERPERGKEESRRRAGLDGESNTKMDGKKTGKGKRKEDADKDKDQDSDNPSKSSSEAGMPVGTEEIWRNFLLGRFSITREDVFSRSSGVGKDVQGKGKGGDRDGDENGKLEVGEQGGSHANDDNGKDTAPVSEKGKASKGGPGMGGKPPQQRIIIKRLRDDLAGPTQIGVASTSKQLTSISTIPEDADDFSQSSTPVQGASSSLPSRGAISTASPPSSRRSQFDSQHPTILVHRHSKVPAFSISRQYRDRGGQSLHTSNSPNGPSSSTLSSSSRLHIIMLAPRDLQEAFTTNAETTRKLPSVIDRHEAVRAAFSPGSLSGHAKGRGSKTDAVATGKEKDKPNKEAKKDKGIILSALKGGRNHTTERERSMIKSDGQIELGRPDGEESGSFGLRYIGRKVSPERNSHRGVHNSVGTKSAPVYSARENYKREQDPAPESAQTLGIRLRLSSAESSQNSESSTSVPSKSSSILKRLLPWDTSSSTSNHSSSKSSFGVTSQSSSTRGTQSMNSDISAPHVPPRVTFTTREQQEAQRGVHQMEHSFERVGLLPSKEKKNGRTGINLHSGGSITSRLSLKKTDVLSAVPTGAFFMLLPLWPAETDMYSQRQYSFEVPPIPLDSRQYLLVFYKALQAESSAKTASPTVDFKKIHISGFRAIARQVSYSELQGTGVRVPEQGISVNGPLEDAFKQMPRSFAALPNSSFDGDSGAQLSVIGASYSRDAGIEFDPEALIELDLCTVLSADRKPPPPGMVAEHLDSEQSMTVKLTPIGSAVMEMIWAGGLALSSFSN